MKIPDEKQKQEVVVKTICKVVGVKCDICGRIIESPSIENRYKWMDDDYKYYAVMTGHKDWGNDSCDSIQHRDICPNCINKFVSDYLNDKNAYRSAYIEIETEHVYYDDVMYLED